MKKTAIRWLWKNTKGQRIQALLNSATGSLRVLFALGFVYASKHIIDIATGNTVGNMMLTALIMGGIIICEITLDGCNTWLDKTMEVKLQNQMRHSLFDRLLKAEWNGIEKHHSGDLLNRIEQDVKDAVTLLASSAPALLTISIQFIASFIFLFKLDNTLVWIIAGIMPIFLLSSKIYMRRMRQSTHDIRKSDSQIQSVIQESLQHRMVIKALERGETLLEKLEGLQSGLQRQVVQKTKLSIFSRAMVLTGFGGGYLAAFLWGAFHLHNGSITFGIMGAFLQLVGQIQRPAVDLAKLIPTFISGYTAAERLIELEQLPIERQGKTLTFDNPIGLKIENISFAYSKVDRQLFDNFSFDFPPNSNIAILGETGAGKTSLIRMMLSLISPQKGSISLYDNKGNKYPVSPLTRSNFVYVPQGNTLFSGTIRENLLLGNPKALDEDLTIALKTASADFVFSLPKGMDTICGERGGGLSEGQAQRITIARALLRPGRILLLDEATSALDPQTEEQLLTRLREKTIEKTIIFVTHRTAIAEMCHKVMRV